MTGRGISYPRYNNAITYVAAVAEVEVNKQTGEFRVTRVCASHDCGEMVNQTAWRTKWKAACCRR